MCQGLIERSKLRIRDLKHRAAFCDQWVIFGGRAAPFDSWTIQGLIIVVQIKMRGFRIPDSIQVLRGSCSVDVFRSFGIIAALKRFIELLIIMIAAAAAAAAEDPI